jgi:pimeloyl-ACP methyl ester carboxylesterase
MLAQVKVPVLFTHHFHVRDEESSMEMGALSDLQANRARQLITGAGQTYLSFPDMPHSTHGHRPELFVQTVLDWAAKLPNH